MAVLLLLVPLSAGCTGVNSLAIPAPNYGGPGIFDEPRGSRKMINLLQLRQDPPAQYRLAANDVLGVYIEGILGQTEEAPPVHFSERENVPPAIGYPIPIREDGTLSLPLVSPLQVAGLTVEQVEQQIKKAYTVDKQILQPGHDRIIVTLMAPRTYHVLVVREDSTRPRQVGDVYRPGTVIQEPRKRGETYAVELRAYENDVLHALSKTGGLPGVDALNEIKILRGAFKDAVKRDSDGLALKQLAAPVQIAGTDAAGGRVLPAAYQSIEEPNSLARIVEDWEFPDEVVLGEANVTRIPLRVGPGDPVVELTPEDIILNTGDVVVIESRESEVFYTGGLLKGGQFPLPRDYDLDVLGAIAMAGGSVAATAGGSGDMLALAGSYGSILPPTRVIVLRTVGCKQVPIRVDLKRALVDPKQRILIQPNDFILMQYTKSELIANILLNNIRFNLTYALSKTN